MQHPEFDRPIQRSALRRSLGKQYFILKRKWKWRFSGTRFARQQSSVSLPHLLFRHASILLRPLPEVDMHLQHNKVTNLKIAIQRLDGLVLAPGETFSYWKRIGKPTRARGFLPGLQLAQGQLTTATGGGLCQLSNLIFWMSLHTPLTVVERWRHGFDVFPDQNRTLPFGSGATCAYNYIDLQLRNDTEQKLQLKLWIGETDLHGEWRSENPTGLQYEVFESNHLFRPEYWGYTRHNVISRHVRDSASGELLYTEPMVENHAVVMYTPLLEEADNVNP